jgi:hypothetical protein
MELLHSHPYGRPVTILNLDNHHNIEINTEQLKEMFEHQEVVNRKIVAFSIVGTFRRGKSFFLNYVLRYLYANVSCQYFIDEITAKSSNFNVLTAPVDQKSQQFFGPEK